MPTLSEQITQQGFRDLDGMVSHHKCDPTLPNGSGNGILYTSVEILILCELKKMTYQIMMDFDFLVRNCEMIYPGCYKRGPHSGDLSTSYDDYYLVTAASKALRLTLSKDVLNHCKRHWGFFDNHQLEIFSKASWKRRFKQWLARNPQFLAHLYFANDIRPCWALRWCWRLGVKANMKSNDADGHIKTWAMCLTAKGMDRKCDEVIGEWEAWAKTQPNLLAATIDENHPMSRAFEL